MRRRFPVSCRSTNHSLLPVLVESRSNLSSPPGPVFFFFMLRGQLEDRCVDVSGLCSEGVCLCEISEVRCRLLKVARQQYSSVGWAAMLWCSLTNEKLFPASKVSQFYVFLLFILMFHVYKCLVLWWNITSYFSTPPYNCNRCYFLSFYGQKKSIFLNVFEITTKDYT